MLNKPKNNLTDKPLELMCLARDGNQDAFATLYNLYFVPVFRYIYLRLRNKEEAEDMVQTVFLKVYQSLPRYEDKGKAPLAYFFTVARNLIIDYWRKKKTYKLDDSETAEKSLVSRKEIDDWAEKYDAKELAQKALSRLEGIQQEVIIMKFMNGYSNQEIAAALDKSEVAIRQIQCRALKNLRLNFKELNLYDN